MKYVVFMEVLKSGRITHISQNRNREFLSLLACICTDNTALPSVLIYKNDFGLL